METLNKSLIIIGNILALAVAEIVMFVFVLDGQDLYLGIPIFIGMIGMAIVTYFSITKMDYSQFHNTFAMFDYHSYVEILKSSGNGFKDLVQMGLALGIRGFILLLVPLLLSLLGYAVMLIVYALYCLTVMIVISTALALAKVEEGGRYAVDTRRVVCPHCGSIFPRSVYICSCGERYPSGDNIELRPSVHGLKHTNCTNDYCGTKLPVTDRHRDRRLLDAVCPECDCPIETREARPFVITLAGPPGSGKTTLAFTAMSALGKRGSVRYPYGDSYSPDTPRTYSPPYMICVDTSAKTERCLAFFDISGEYFDNDYQGQQPQYGQEDLILVVVDTSARNAEDAEMAVNDFWQKEHTAAQTSLTSSISTPLHLVVTHKDRVGAHDDVRKHLESEGYGQMVSMLESSFSSVRYHICDARSEDEVSGVLRDVFGSVDKGVASVFGKA